MTEQAKNQNVQENQVQEQAKKAAEEKARQKAEAKKAAEEKARQKELAINIEGVYHRYVTLKFIVLDGGKLKEQIAKELAELEKTVAERKWKKAKKTVTASVGTFILKMVKDMPIPPSYEKVLKENGVMGKYV